MQRKVVVNVDSARVVLGRKVIGIVRRGQELIAVERRGKWVGVKWTDSSGVTRKGWIKSELVAAKVKEGEREPRPSERLGPAETSRLVRAYVHGTKDKRKRIHEQLRKTGQVKDAEALIRDHVAEAVNNYIKALQEEGRERLLKEYLASDAVCLKDGEDAAFKMQRKLEEYSYDYRGAWPEHVWLLENGAAVGLRPKNRKIVAMLAEAREDRFGVPAWLKSGPIIILRPERGKWKVSSVVRISYAKDITRMLIRQEKEKTALPKKKD